jgi:hypothetical protein
MHQRLATDQVASIRGLFRAWARLLSGQDDPGEVPMRDARGLRQRWQAEVDRRLEAKEISANTAKQYRKLGRRAISWAREHLHRFDKAFGPEVLSELDGPMWALIQWLEQQDAVQAHRLGVQRLFRFMEQEGHTLDDLATGADAILEEFEAHLATQGRTPKTQKSVYGDALRGLRQLQEGERISVFALRPYPTIRRPRYAISYQQFPNRQLREVAMRYAEQASEVLEMGDDTWKHPVVSEVTRHNNLRSLEQYVGYAEQVARVSTERLSMDELFARELLEGFVVHVGHEAQAGPGQVSGGAQTHLKRLAAFAYHHLGVSGDIIDDRFDDLISPSRNTKSRRPRKNRIRKLCEWVAMVREAEQRIALELNPQRRLCLQRLRMLMLVSLAIPHRSGCLRTLRLHEELVKDKGIWWVRLPASRPKTRRAFEMALPAYLYPDLEEYLSNVRSKILRGRECPYVFPSGQGNAVADRVVNEGLASLDAQANETPPDHAVTLHTTRHTVVIECIRRLGEKAMHRAGKLVGHASTETTRKFYAKISRELTERDREAERILDRDELSDRYITRLIQILAKEPGELARFLRAMEAVKVASTSG